MKNIVEAESAGKRLDQYVSNMDKNITRVFAQKLITEGNVLVNGKNAKSSYRIKVGDEISLKKIVPKEANLLAEKIDLDILYEDKDIIIINKAKGMVVHPGNGNPNGTIVNALMHSHKDNLSQINGVIRPGIVHRIDKDTSGVIVVAKTDKAHKNLSEKFKKHDLKRQYIALVQGIVDKDNLKINLPIGRDISNRKKMAVTTKNSKEAITYIKVLERYIKSGYTLVEATLETGRTHQIRVHMSYAGYPIVGDSIYGKTKNEFGVKGQMLHAKMLGINHPTSEKYIEFESDLPKEFNDIIQMLRKKER